MAATYWLDVSLVMDDIGWHFLNFGEPALVRETEAGLLELGLEQHAKWFAEAHSLMQPLLAEIYSPEEYYRLTKERGERDRIEVTSDQLNRKAAHESCMFAAWVRYARNKPENVFAA